MSAAIRHHHYTPETAELSLWFGPEGRRYIYSDVPLAVYEGLRDAPSRGRYFNAVIRNRFACRLADPSALRNRRWQAIRSAS
ncbi:KTSC domain-containing protein [Devosia chinhatensis]|nr:KTSC domain-containing protein [Devosia chinhatensis]